MRVAAHGKAFALDGSPFRFRGISYGRATGTARLDLASIAAAGYTVVSLSPPPPPDIEAAVASGLHFLLEFDDARLGQLGSASWPERRRLVRELTAVTRSLVGRWDGSDALLGLVLGGHRDTQRGSLPTVADRQIAEQLAAALHDEESSLLAAWRGVWPQEAQCPAEFDFLLSEYAIAAREHLAPSIVASHSHVGDRPLVVGPVSLRGGAPDGDRDLEWTIDTTSRCGAGGTIERAPSAEEAGFSDQRRRINRRTVRDLDVDWPSISIVITAYNAAGTIDECLRHCGRLGYPQLEVVVVDDGSTDSTPELATRRPGVRLIRTAHAGLSAGRNAGYRAAVGDLVAYLDADAYPSPDWPWYIALAALDERVGGSGGPNIPPPEDPVSARVVARAPGGPVPQLLGADRAAHVPGCNMAFWRHTLERLDGFDPVIDGSEDLEFEWRVLDSEQEIAYHPAALVWHHRRPGLVPYLRQQRRYGRGQAILERRCPERFPAFHRVRRAATRLRPTSREAERRSLPVCYVTLPGQESALLGLAHQWGMPGAVILGATAPLALVRRKLAAPAVLASLFVAALFVVDVAHAGRGRRRAERSLELRARLAVFRILRPLAFRWGHLSGRWELRARDSAWPLVPGPAAGHRGPGSLERPSSGEHHRDGP